MAGIRLSSILFAISISSVVLCCSVFQACSKRLKACESLQAAMENPNLKGLIVSLTEQVDLLETRVTDLQAERQRLFEQEYLRLAAVETERVTSARQCLYDEGRKL
jgi:hypothetical protein